MSRSELRGRYGSCEGHRQAASVATISVYRRDEQLELGVLDVDEADNVIGYDEKPTLQLDVSMGAYAMSPTVFDSIPAGRYDMPQLILDLISAGQRVVAHRHGGMWFDIGRLDDYERANELFLRDPASFLSDGATQDAPVRRSRYES
jgi:NDP-sugar pyrophosphorylase family protein